ncbi:MAG TPA: molybdopterin cofactor-binding domain-containing protein, partial [Candidatus Sulfopaludibacter sp.]|nr:molybdopterin cofactor-binding domain-containing protein [Candidatus Sulfopaludibacter sp.]
MSNVMVVHRRDFLAGAAGLIVGLVLPSRKAPAQGRGQVSAKPWAYIHIAPDDTVTFTITKAEMGQGTVTSLSMLLGEELDCDWKKVRTEFAPVDPATYGMQGVFGSASIRSTWNPLRRAGATARAMLVAAAAQKWGMDAAQLRTDNGFVIGPSGRLSYGALTEAAAKLPMPENVPTKDPAQYKLIGKPVPRLDTRDKVNGKAQFGLDARQPGMLYASLARCPVFGGKVASFDMTKAKAVPGVKQVVEVPQGVAVIADNTWSAMQGRNALDIKWDEGPNANQSSANISRIFAELAQQPGAVAKKAGDADQALAGAGKKLEAVYEAPYLSHAPMEPLNCTAVVRADSCEVWASTQQQAGSRDSAVRATGLKPEQVNVHTLYMGGGFGRRANVDYVGETIEIAKRVPGVPVKLTWSREDDMQHDVYRPASYVKFAGAVDSDGWPLVYTAKIACPTFFSRGNGVDGTAVEGLHDLEYQIPHMLIDFRRADVGIPTSFWRAVGYTQNTFFAESFLDELAAAGGKDPVEVRRRLLTKSPRLLGVLNRAVEQAGWGKAPAGHYQGVAVVNNIGSFTAQVAEISVTQGKLRVHRVVCAVDCGHVVNPAIVKQQIESGIVYGL